MEFGKGGHYLLRFSRSPEVITEAMEGAEDGVKVGKELLKYLQFADDQGMVTSADVGLEHWWGV